MNPIINRKQDILYKDLAVDVHINRLRRKLGLQNDIQTVYKVGYRLNSAN